MYSLEDIDIIAEKRFSIQSLRPMQREVIFRVVYACQSEKEKRQVVILPTGAGKSLCFMLPALMIDGITLIIYPLLSLMTDQKRRLDEANIDCVVFSGGKSEREWEEMWAEIENGCKIIIANPEILCRADIVDTLKQFKLSHFVIDEAHCVVEWGESFRPSYLALPSLIEKLKPVCVSAFTATASDRVLFEMRRLLFSSENAGEVIRGEGDRKNIRYYAVKTYSKMRALKELCISEKRPLLVFSGTRLEAEYEAKTMYDFLQDRGERDSVYFYHAGLTKKERARIEEWFYQSSSGILFATCAYGMGVDKKNIRTVIHSVLPPSIEAYMQESGRAGRDGEDARAILLYNDDDLKETGKIQEYIQTKTCRRNFLLSAMGEEKKVVCSGCDICDGVDCSMQKDAKEALQFIKANDKYLKESSIIHYLCYKKRWTADEAKDVLKQLLNEGRIKKCGFLWGNRIAYCF